MARKSLPLSRVYGLLEPGPVVLLMTAGSERPRTLHHREYGNFMVAGDTIKLRSKMK